MPLARFADASYSSKEVKGYTIDKSLSTDNYTTYYNSKDKTAVIAFSGTRILNDPNYFGILKNGIWETDLATDWAVANNDIRGTSRYDECIMATDTFYSKYHDKGYKVATTGHSLGGRIAMEVSADMKSDGKLVIAEVYNPFFYDGRVDVDEGDYGYCIVHYNPHDPYSKHVAKIPSRAHATLIPAQITKPLPAQTTPPPPAQTTPPPPAQSTQPPPAKTKPTQKPTAPHHKESMWHWLGKEAKHHPWKFAAAVIGGAILAVGAAAVTGPAIMGAIAGQGAVEGVAAAGAEVATEAVAEGAAEGAAETAAEGVAEDSEFVDAVSEEPEEIPKDPEEEPFYDTVEEQPDLETTSEQPSGNLQNFTSEVEDLGDSTENIQSNTENLQTTVENTGENLAEDVDNVIKQGLKTIADESINLAQKLFTNLKNLMGQFATEAGKTAAKGTQLFTRGFVQYLSNTYPALARTFVQFIKAAAQLGLIEPEAVIEWTTLTGGSTSATAAAGTAAVGTAGVTVISSGTSIASATGTVLSGAAYLAAVIAFLEATKLFVKEASQILQLIKENRDDLDHFIEQLTGVNSHSLNQYTSHEPTSVLPSTASSMSLAKTNTSVVVHKSTPIIPAQKPKNHYVVKAKYNNRH